MGAAQFFSQMKNRKRSRTSQFFTHTILGSVILVLAISTTIAAGGTFALLLFSLHSEDQRHYLKCRMEGKGANDCLKLVSGV